MPKKVRLSRKEYPHMRPLFREHGTLFVASVSPSPRGPRLGCVVPKKVAPKSSARNLIKRQVRAVLSDIVDILPSAVIFFQAKKDAAQASFEDIRNDVTSVVRKIRVRHGV